CCAATGWAVASRRWSATSRNCARRCCAAACSSASAAGRWSTSWPPPSWSGARASHWPRSPAGPRCACGATALRASPSRTRRAACPPSWRRTRCSPRRSSDGAHNHAPWSCDRGLRPVPGGYDACRLPGHGLSRAGVNRARGGVMQHRASRWPTGTGGRWGAAARLVPAAAVLAAAVLVLGPSAPAGSATTTVPSPTAGGWSMLGTAKVVTTTSPSTLQLTDAATAGHEAGLAYWPTAVAGAGLNATFTALINSGTGADGLAFDLLDASAGNPVLGVDGGGLGFSGNHGIAVALDTYKNSVNPSNNFVGVATGAGPTTDTLAWAATSTNVPALRSAPVTVTVATTSTALTVTVNGTQVISWTGTIPANAYVAFSAGDGGLTDLHAVENVSITSGTSAGPGVLSVSPTTVAFGSVATNTTATSSFTLTNTGGTALTVTAVTPPAAPFSATSPITVNTTIAPNQTLTQTVTFTPTAAGAANGSYSITVNDGQAAHVVTLTGTGTTSGGGGGGGGAVPSPTAGGWSMLGTAKVVTTTSPSTLQLTDAATAGHEAGLAYWPTAVAGAGLNATFTALINSGTGADGLAF